MFHWFCPDELTTSMNCENFLQRVPSNCTANQTAVVVLNDPLTSDIIVDLYECTQPTSCVSLWSVTPANRPTIEAETFIGTSSSFDDTAITAGNWLNMVIVQTGASHDSGAHLSVALRCEETE